MSLVAYLVVAAILLAAGLAMVASRRSLIHVLIGLELVLNASALNFVAFDRYSDGGQEGQLAALFVIVVAAAEAALGLAIVLHAYSSKGSIRPDDFRSLGDS